MRRFACMICLGVVACATTPDVEDEDGSVQCVAGSLHVALATHDPAHAELHEAVLTIPGTYVATATWYGEMMPTQVTTTLTFAEGSYSVDVVDQTVFCSIHVGVPIHMTIQTADGYLLVDTVSEWGLAEVTGVNAPAEQLGFVTGSITDPQDPAWFGASVAQMWPDLASPDDDAELRLLVQHRRGSVEGLLTYEKREIVDQTTVLYGLEVLLEWGS